MSPGLFRSCCQQVRGVTNLFPTGPLTTVSDIGKPPTQLNGQPERALQTQCVPSV